MDDEKKYKFQMLTPSHEANLSVYDEALAYVFSDGEIKNIALSGSYSSGKSSIIETFEKKNPKYNFLHISLAHFLEESNANALDDANAKETSIEGKILNQLIQQIDPKYIPQTRFRIKRKLNEKSPYLITFLVSTVAVLFVYLFKFDDWKNYIISNDFDFLKFTTHEYCRIAAFVYVLFALIYTLFKIIINQYNKQYLKRLNIKGNEIEIFEQDKSSYFDKYLNEVLYVFENCQADCIVFEDIDRFENVTIFERLREINTLVNCRLINEDKTLRFFYLLRDDVFQNKDRTKFFDFVIPVIPIVSSTNSYDVLISSFKGTNYEVKLDDHFLRGVSLYLDDYRLIKNILNEFYIYENKLNTIELDCNKLLAIIIYKNLFPKDYSNLVLNKGYVYSIFNNKTSLINSVKENYKRKIALLKERLDYYDNEFLESQLELDIIKKQKYDDARYYQSKMNDYNSWVENSYKKRSQAISDRKENYRDTIVKEKSAIENDIEKLDNSTIKELLDRDNIDAYFHDTVSINDIGEMNDFGEIKASDYLDLLKYLISNGYIDETYTDYLSYFYANSLSIHDKKFLRSVTDRKSLAETYSIENPKLVLENLNTYDLTQIEVRNYDLFDYILQQENQDQCEAIVQNICFANQHSFIRGFLNRNSYQKLIRQINIHCPDYIKQVLNLENFTKNEVEKYCTATLLNCDCNTLDSINKNNILANWISNDEDFLNTNDDNKTDENIEIIIHAMQHLNIQFVFINYGEEINKKLFTEVYEKSLYELNGQNLKLMIDIKNSEADLSSLLSTIFRNETKSVLFQYMKNNIEKGINSYLEIFSDIIMDSSETIIQVINCADICEELKIGYISQLGTCVEDINEVEELSMQQYLLKYTKIQYTAANIISCFKLFDLSKELIDFINSNQTALDYSHIIEEKDLDIFFRKCLCEMNIEDEKYEQILSNIGKIQTQFNIDSISDNKMTILIRMGLIQMNSSNISFIRKHYKNHLESFIIANLDEYITNLNSYGKDHEEIRMLLMSQYLSEQQKIRIIDSANVDINLEGLDVSDTIKLLIITEHFDTNNLNYVVSSYPKENDEIKKAIRCHIVESFYVYERSHDFNITLLLDLLSEEALNFDQKVELVEVDINRIDDKYLKLILQKIGASKIASNLFENTNHRIEYNNENIKIVKILEAAGIIESPEITNGGKFYKKLKLKQKRTI